MMTLGRILGAAIFTLTGTQAFAGETHEHGHTEMKIAIGEKEMRLELEVPGMDVVGFETAAKDDEQRAAVAAALKSLNDPALFVPNSEAGCLLGEADAEQEQGEEHAGFEVKMVFTCQDTSKIQTLETPWFERFPASKELEVEAVGTKGQTSMELEPGDTVIDLSAING